MIDLLAEVAGVGAYEDVYAAAVELEAFDWRIRTLSLPPSSLPKELPDSEPSARVDRVTKARVEMNSHADSVLNSGVKLESDRANESILQAERHDMKSRFTWLQLRYE